MLENSSLPGNSIEDPRYAEEGGGGPVSDGYQDAQEAVSGEEVVDRNFTFGRWPSEETRALLKIRSDMDVAFRDKTPKVLRWEQVSRRLTELGYNRSARKCKEKFKNVYKYYRRTKEGRYGRPNSKTYRFFEQLEPLLISPDPEKNEEQVENTAKSRKLSQYFERLMNEVVEKQEKLQKNFIEMLEKFDQDTIARKEAWKVQELAMVKRERELLAEERAIVAAKDAAVLALLRKFTERAGPLKLPENLLPDDEDKDEQGNDNAGSSVIEKQECRNGGDFTQVSSTYSRWPKDEVKALIELRTNVDVENERKGLKGSLWEEISCGMKKLGYDRSAKKCRKKWENMNKYFKRMKEKNKTKPEDSKTCTYFHQLDALYECEKPKKVDDSGSSGKDQLKPEELLMHIMEGQSRSSSEDADREEGSE